MYEIEISDQQGWLSLDHEQLRDTAKQLLAAEQVASAKISLAFVDNETIHALNREFLQHDYPTDVISFLFNEKQQFNASFSTKELPRGARQAIEGEVIISTETAIREAENFNWSPQEETVLYLIHGLLHLAGYDDLSDDERALMRRREREILILCDFDPPDSHMDEPPGESQHLSENSLSQGGERS